MPSGLEMFQVAGGEGLLHCGRTFDRDLDRDFDRTAILIDVSGKACRVEVASWAAQCLPS